METGAFFPRRNPRGFTLTELLVVIAIIGILAAIIIPVVGTVRNKARMTTATTNLRSIHTAFVLYSQDNKKEICPGYDDSLSGYSAFFPLRLKNYIDQPQSAYSTFNNIFLSPFEETTNPNGSYVMNYNCSKGGAPLMGIPEARVKRFTDFEAPQLLAFLYDNGQGSGHGTGTNITKRDGKFLILYLDGHTRLRETIEAWNTGMWIAKLSPQN